MKKNRIAYLPALLLCALPAAAHAQNPPLRTVLTGAEARTVLSQCSRSSPRDVRELWVPTEREIDTLERDYPRWICDVEAPSLEGVVRQYVGIVRDGRRYIYMNAFPKDVADRYPGDWKHKGVMVCDGGRAFFGMLYDVAARRFLEPAFNGEA